MKNLLFICFLYFAIDSIGQNQSAEDFGFRHLQTIYKADRIKMSTVARSPFYCPVKYRIPADVIQIFINGKGKALDNLWI
jgi:hypothetical protein